MVSYILITGYRILLFMNPLNFVVVILKVLLVNLLAAVNFPNVFLNKKKRLENKKNVKNVFTSMEDATMATMLTILCTNVVGR